MLKDSQFAFKDCYYQFSDGLLRIGNSVIERQIRFYNNCPVTTGIRNKKTGYGWGYEKGQGMAMFNIPIFEFSRCFLQVRADVSNNEGLSEDFLVVQVLFEGEDATVKLQFQVFPELPFITSYILVKGSGVEVDHGPVHEEIFDGISQDKPASEAPKGIQLPDVDAIDAFSISNAHLKLESVRLFDVTDKYDNLVEKSEELLFVSNFRVFSGNMFVVKAYLDDEELMVVKEGPTEFGSLNRKDGELRIRPKSALQLVGSGIDYEHLDENEFTLCYGCTIGVGSLGSLKRQYKRLYGKVYTGGRLNDLFIMSNTWGDRSQDTAISESFIKKELETAKCLGVDVVQIDDGWQEGITGNSALVKGGVWEGGYYDFNPEFWKVNTKKFPNGLEAIAEYANDNSIELGLWFSPDAARDYENWQKDVETLVDLYEKYNIRHFKLDGLRILNKRCERNIVKFLAKVSARTGNNVTFNVDVTAGVRLGYLYYKQFGTIFVENRYTDWVNYYPHTTLKNLWCLSELFPSRRFQFEVLNNRRNVDKYGNDLLAPKNYSIDYIFATTMVANPLMWMEMCNLSEEDKEVLAKVISVYKRERKAMYVCEVLPIGDMPDGASFTGFQLKLNDTEGYFLFFREHNSESEYEYRVHDVSSKALKCEVLYSNADVNKVHISSVVSASNRLTVGLPEMRSFAFVKYRVVSDC
jgi:alpha-galactosidase